MGDLWNLACVVLAIFCTSSYVLHYVCSLPLGFSRLRASVPVFVCYLVLPPLVTDPRRNAVGTVILSTFLSWWASFKLLALCWGTGPLTTLAIFARAPEREQGPDGTSLNPGVQGGPQGLRQRGNRSKANGGIPVKASGPAGRVPTSPGLLSFTAILVLPMALEAGVEDNDEASPIRSLFEALGCLAVFISCIYALDFRHLYAPLVIDLLYVAILYAFLLFMFCLTAAFAKGLLGIRLASHFHNPFLSSSLTDFWGRRWNRVAQQLLLVSTYRPVKRFLLEHTAAGCNIAHGVAVFCTFAVSGLMHELIIYYAIGHINGLTLEWTAFFLVHALGVICEGLLWNVAQQRRMPCLPRLLCWLWAASFIVATVRGLFFPPTKRNGLDLICISEFRSMLPGPSLTMPSLTMYFV